MGGKDGNGSRGKYRHRVQHYYEISVTSMHSRSQLLGSVEETIGHKIFRCGN